MTEIVEQYGDDLQKYQSRQPAVIPPAEMGLTQQESFFAAVERLAINPNVDPAKIKQFMDMQEHVLDRRAKQEFSAAMVKVQSNIPEVPRDKTNYGTKPPSKYSSYEMIMKHCKPVYTAEGFAISAYEGSQIKENETFPPIPEGEVRIFGDVMHEGGWSKTYYVDIPLDDKGPQGTKNKTLPHAKKSSLSYGRSTLMCMILNIPTGDGDDGNAASQEEPEPINQDQIDEIEELRESGSADKKTFDEWLDKEYSVKAIDRLDTVQGGDVIKRLKAKAAYNSKKKAA